MKSTIGRPRRLTDEQVSVILAWHEQLLGWKALRGALKTQRQLAQELGVSTATISRVIACRGQFKQPSPERRAVALSERGRRLARLRARGLR
jgi:transposase